MAKVFIVQNNDSVIMGVFRTKRKASAYAKSVGEALWKETWDIAVENLDKPDSWWVKHAPVSKAQQVTHEKD